MTAHEKFRKAAQHFLDLARRSTDKNERKRLLEKSLRFAQAAEDLQFGSNSESSHNINGQIRIAPPGEGAGR